MDDQKKYIDNLDYNLAYEKLFMPDVYSDDSNYTLNKAYAISNEQLYEVFKSFKLNGKKVLTVGSSGDQALNAILKGSKNVTIIDANIFSRPFIEYKLAVIKTYNYDSFSDIFIKSDFFNWQVYAKISHLLSKNVRAFWDSLILDIDENNYGYDFSGKTIKEKMLYIDHRDRYSSFYKSKIAYTKLQSLLNSSDIQISFITAELQEFPIVLKDYYDMIYLSNIFDYYKGDKAILFEETLEKLYNNNLNNNGIIVANYGFNQTIKNAPTQIINHAVEHLEISRFLDGQTNQDVAWIIRKRNLNRVKNK